MKSLPINDPDLSVDAILFTFCNAGRYNHESSSFEVDSQLYDIYEVPLTSPGLLKKEIDLSTSLYSLLNISISLTLFRSFLSIKIIRQSEIAESPVYRASTLVIISKADDPYDMPVKENINKKIKTDNLAKLVIIILLSY